MLHDPLPYTSDIIDEYRHLTEKIFVKEFQLIPLVDNDSHRDVSNERSFHYARLQNQKKELNHDKAQINVMVSEYGLQEWRLHTSSTHPTKELPMRIADFLRTKHKEHLVTQAYCKFLELCKRYQLPGESPPDGPFRTLHLCESPGSFILALENVLTQNMHKVRKGWDWLMNSLNPYNELNDPKSMILDDSFIANNLDHMCFGEDDSGNILHWTEAYINSLGKFHLITADGGFDCTANPGEQELVVYPLIKKEVEVALSCLEEGGIFLLKIFTFFEQCTIDLLEELMSNFHRIICVKPASSKPGNSEIYLIGFDFIGPNQKRANIVYLQAIARCAEYFTDCQRAFINFNIKKFNRITLNERTAMNIHKLMIVDKMEKFLIDPEQEILEKNLITVRAPALTPWFLFWTSPSPHITQSTWDEGPIELQTANFDLKWSELSKSVVFATNENSTQLIQFTHDKHVINSLFTNHEIMLPHLHKVRDLCEDLDLPCDAATIATIHCSYDIIRNEGRNVDNTSKPLNRLHWLEWLSELSTERVSSVTIIFPEHTLILSRFTASMLVCLFGLFHSANLNKNQIAFSCPKEAVFPDLMKFLNHLKETTTQKLGTHHIMQFIPLSHFANYYDAIVRFNSRQINQL